MIFVSETFDVQDRWIACGPNSLDLPEIVSVATERDLKLEQWFTVSSDRYKVCGKPKRTVR